MREWEEEAMVALVGMLHNWLWWLEVRLSDGASSWRVCEEQPVSRTLFWFVVVGRLVGDKQA